MVKPNQEGSSVGVRIVRDPGEPAIDRNDWPYGSEVLVERYIPGRELTVGVLGDRPLAVTEIGHAHGFFDYHAKYTANEAEHLIPAPLPPELYERALDQALRAHRVLGCRGVTRSDFRLDPDDPDGLYLLELNTQPGMTPISLVPEQAAHVGIGFADLVAPAGGGGAMRRMTLAARRARIYLRRPPRPRWWQPAIFGGSLALALCLVGGLGFWLGSAGVAVHAGSALTDHVLALTARLGFAVREVYADGRVRTDPEALRSAARHRGRPADPRRSTPTLTRARLEQLPWVERASVERMLPDRVQVRLIERQPLALWQRAGRFALIDRGGEVIAPDVAALDGMGEGPGVADPEADPAIRWGQLRVLVGDEAPRHAARLFALLSTEPELWARVVAATWVGERRWTLRLDNRIDVLLPEQSMLRAWRLLAAEGARGRAARARDLGDRSALPAGPGCGCGWTPKPCRTPRHEVRQRRGAQSGRAAAGRPARADRRARHRHDQDVLPDRAPARRRPSSCSAPAISSPKGCAPARSSTSRRSRRRSWRWCTRPSSRPARPCARWCSASPPAGRTRAHAPIELEIGHRPVTGADLSRALAHAQAEARTGGVEVLHALPVEITLDGGQPLRDPRGMIGGRLRVGVHLICAAAAPIHNLVAAVERCHLEVAGVVAAPYASGLASLSDDEASLGALVLDLGGGVTGVARFAEGRVQEIHAVPLGGQHVTQDLAFGLSTGRAQAERLKSLYGSVLSRAGDARQQLEVPGIGDPGQPPVQIVSRARLTEIIRPRVEETLQLVRARIDGSPLAGRRLVLTGGASQIEGIVELAEELFDMPARVGRARPFAGGPRPAGSDRRDHRRRAPGLVGARRGRPDLRVAPLESSSHQTACQVRPVAARELLSKEPKKACSGGRGPRLGPQRRRMCNNDHQSEYAGDP